MPLTRTPTIRRTAGVLAACTLMLLAAAGCSGGSAGDDTTASTATGSYAECMQKNGVTVTMPSGRPSGMPSGMPSGLPRPSGSARPGGDGFPGGGGGFRKPDGVDDATWEKAQTACASLRPSGGAGGNRNGRGDGMSAAYRNCLQDHGATPGPDLASADTAAVEACKALAPTPGPTKSS